MTLPATDNTPRTARETADVETSSAGYAQRFVGPVGEWFLAVQARATLELLGAWPGVRILDVGGGHGQLAGPLVEAGFELTVYGSDPVCGERVRRWVEAGQARFVSGDLLKTPFEDDAFDVVLSYRLLPHVARWRKLIAELCRVARVAVIVDYPTRRSVNAISGALFGLKRGIEKNTRPFIVFQDREIAEAFAACGFRVTARRPQFLLPMALHRGLALASVSRALERGLGALGLTRGFGSPVILRLEPRG
jgi:2-polyprenyl-3-methyl-5-hydroxy-6-metoxy-1,4-benzoquinol methylase